MSTIKEEIIKEILNGISMVDGVTILLKLRSIKIGNIAKHAGVSRQMLHAVLSGKRESKKVKQAISKALGFNPWE